MSQEKEVIEVMKTRLFLTLLGLSCLLNTVKAENADCGLPLTKDVPVVDFPDIMKDVGESYIMGVEYSVPGAKQTDYYTEYYNDADRKGRLDVHIGGENTQYIYVPETWEAWILSSNSRKCELTNISVTPEFFRDDQTDWMHFKGTEMPTTIGPSAMFKIAYDVWKMPAKDRKMAYMGKYGGKLIRGEDAVYWRRCTEGNTYVDYIFAGDDAENPFDTDALGKVITPLRVEFHGVSAAEEKELSEQSYDIISFQHFIPKGFYPFELPKGRNCLRGDLVVGPALPDFSSSSFFLFAEVVYRKYGIKDDELLSSYYSTFMFGLDREINHLAYYYSSWNTTKPDKEHQEPFVNAPHYIVYDMSHTYAYKINYRAAQCSVSRESSFVPQYKLPENGGNLALTDVYVLFPNNELTFFSTGTDRGIKVNLFEAEIKNYKLDEDTIIPKAFVTHTYLQDNEELENSVEVRNAPTQIEMHLFRKDDIEEVLTLNIYGFTTRIPNKQQLFDVTRCFKNDDDYSFLTIGFEVESMYMTQIEKKLPQIEENVLGEITLKSELNAVRIPSVTTDLQSNYVYVTMLILGKPPLQLDFPDSEDNKIISVSNDDDVQGVSDFDTCANNCLEQKSDCWGFSLCGATCYFGSAKSTEVKEKKDCTLYRRHSNDTFMPSKELQIENIIRQVEADEFRTMVTLDNGERIELRATIAQVTDPAEDDSLFEKMGNLLNPRMKVVKAGTKLKKASEVKNLGKLRYDECQQLCLDFKDCETVSYCLMGGKCVISSKYGGDLKAEDLEDDPLCNVLTRKYADHFVRTPGVFVKASGGTEKDVTTVEDCAKACLKEDKFKCLSFDHCAGQDKKGCTLYTTHYLNSKSKEQVTDKSPRCGHYTRKFSNDFKRKDETRIVGSKVPPIMNLTLEECAKSCIDYGQGSCYGYDFCQDKALFATSCILLDTDPSRLKSTYSAICTNYLRSQPEYAPRPFTNSYAGGIGFLCFLVGGILGIIAVFVIAYIRVNRQQ